MDHKLRIFHIVRDGTILADGVVWEDGSSSVRWRGPDASIVFWPKVESAVKIHTSTLDTRIEWDH